MVAATPANPQVDPLTGWSALRQSFMSARGRQCYVGLHRLFWLAQAPSRVSRLESCDARKWLLQTPCCRCKHLRQQWFIIRMFATRRGTSGSFSLHQYIIHQHVSLFCSTNRHWSLQRSVIILVRIFGREAHDTSVCRAFHRR